MAAYESPPGARGDEAELFRAYNDELMRTVARAVPGVSPQTIEDACAFAWAQFMAHQPDRDRTREPGCQHRQRPRAPREGAVRHQRPPRALGTYSIDKNGDTTLTEMALRGSRTAS